MRPATTASLSPEVLILIASNGSAALHQVVTRPRSNVVLVFLRRRIALGEATCRQSKAAGVLDESYNYTVTIYTNQVKTVSRSQSAGDVEKKRRCVHERRLMMFTSGVGVRPHVVRP